MIYIDKNSDEPYYIQIYKQIQKEILEGKLQKGTILQGSRTLAQELGIGRNTVDNAYTQLAAEGYIESKKGIGFVVLEIEQLRALHIKERSNSNQVKHSVTNQNIKYDLSYGNFKRDSFPAKLWKRYISEILLESAGEKINYYPPKEGDLFLREQLKNYLERARGVRCIAKQIIITGGLQHSLEIVCKLLTNKKGIAIENPGYDGAMTVFKNNDLKVYPIPLDNKGIDISLLQTVENVKAVYITPSHQFPTGITMPIGRRYELLKWAQENKSYIIEDDFDSEYRYHTGPVPSLQSIDCNGKVIYLGTFSKALSPSMRMAYMILPEALLHIYHEKFEKYKGVTSWIDQYIVARMLEKQEYERHVRRMCLEFRKKHDLLLAEIKKMSSKMKVKHSGAGLYLILEFPKEMPCEKLIKKAAQNGVRVYDTKRYYLDEKDKPCNEIFIGFSLIEMKEIPDCMERLQKAWL